MIVKSDELLDLRIRLLAVAVAGEDDDPKLQKLCLDAANSVNALAAYLEDDYADDGAIASASALADALQLLAHHKPAKGRRRAGARQTSPRTQ